jgi:Tfp pilus assembly PilM family ATPase
MPIVEQMEVLDLPHGAMKEGKIQSVDLVIDSVRRIVQRLKIEKMPTAIALPIQNVTHKRIQWIKTLSRNNIEKTIEDNLSRYFPGVAQDLCYDYIRLPQANKMHDTVLLTATRHDHLNEYVNTIERTGLSVKIVDVDIYALVRATRTAMVNEPLSSLTAIVEFNPDIAQLIVFNQNEIVLHQELDCRDTQVFYNKFSSTIQLYYSAHSIGVLNKIYISGDTENMSQIMTYMKEHLEIPIHPIDLFQSVIFSSSISKDKKTLFSKKMMVSFGLALRRMPPW